MPQLGMCLAITLLGCENIHPGLTRWAWLLTTLAPIIHSCRPQVIEMLKFGWIQFLATIVPLYWFFSALEYVVFQYRVLSTRVVSDFQPTKQKF